MYASPSGAPYQGRGFGGGFGGGERRARGGMGKHCGIALSLWRHVDDLWNKVVWVYLSSVVLLEVCYSYV